jgi:glycosyltransferase involved in cell wall biosynthesis
VDVEFFSRPRARPWDRKFNRPLIVLPARIVPTKGHDDLVDAVRRLAGQGIAVDVAFAGRADQPEYEAAIRRRISEFRMDDSFHFLGLLEPARLRDLYAVSSVLAFPTYHGEGLPRILLEAQAMQLPVVVYDTGGSRAALVPGETGALIKTGDREGFANAIASLISSPAQARTWGEAGRRFILGNFTAPALAVRHERFYLQTINRSAGDASAEA